MLQGGGNISAISYSETKNIQVDKDGDISNATRMIGFTSQQKDDYYKGLRFLLLAKSYESLENKL